MTYDHRTKAGNRGDIWKHAILVHTAAAMLRNDKVHFSYFETHAGRSTYDIPFGDPRRQWLDRLRMQGRECVPEYRHLLPQDPAAYLSSWGLIRKMVTDRKRACTMILCESDESVRRDLGVPPDGWGDRVAGRVFPDGYAAARNYVVPPMTTTITLIDPPYVEDFEWIETLKLATEMRQRGRPFLLWAPTTPAKTSSLFRGVGDFYEIEWSGGGCVMVASETPLPIDADLDGLARLLDGEFVVR